MGEDRTVCVGLDTHKAKIAVAVAEPGRSGEVRFQGEITNQADAVRRLIERLADKHGRLKVCYEAGPCGYGLYPGATHEISRLKATLDREINATRGKRCQG